MAFENFPGVQLTPFDFDPAIAARMVAALQNSRQLALQERQQASAEEDQKRLRAIQVAQILQSLGSTGALPSLLGQAGVELPPGTTVPPSEQEQRQSLLKSLPPDQAETFRRVGLLGPIAGLPPDKMQEAFQIQAGTNLTAAQTADINVRLQGQVLERERLDIERSRATTEAQRAKLDDRVLQLRIGEILAGSVPGIDPKSGQVVPREEFERASDEISSLVSKGLPVPGRLWSKVVPVDRAAALAKQASALPPEVEKRLEIEAALFNALSRTKKPDKKLLQPLFDDIWQTMHPPQPGAAPPKEQTKEGLLDRAKTIFSNLLGTPVGKELSSVIESNVGGLLSVAGTRELRPVNAPAAKDVSPADKTQIKAVTDGLLRAGKPQAFVSQLEGELVTAAMSKDRAAFDAAIKRLRDFIGAQGGGAPQPTP